MEEAVVALMRQRRRLLRQLRRLPARTLLQQAAVSYCRKAGCIDGAMTGRPTVGWTLSTMCSRLMRRRGGRWSGTERGIICRSPRSRPKVRRRWWLSRRRRWSSLISSRSRSCPPRPEGRAEVIRAEPRPRREQNRSLGRLQRRQRMRREAATMETQQRRLTLIRLLPYHLHFLQMIARSYHRYSAGDASHTSVCCICRHSQGRNGDMRRRATQRSRRRSGSSSPHPHAI